jgi:hypothetical protein
MCSSFTTMLHLWTLYLIFDFLGTNVFIVFVDKENCDHEEQKTKVFMDANFLHPDGADMDEDHN